MLHFVRKQLQLLPVAAIILIGVSMLEPRQVRALALAGELACAWRAHGGRAGGWASGL
jgi:hypothetical protein